MDIPTFLRQVKKETVDDGETKTVTRIVDIRGRTQGREISTIRYKDKSICEDIVHFKDGIAFGECIQLYLGRKKIYEMKDNKLEGRFRIFDKHKTLVEEGFYVNDKRHGMWKKWGNGVSFSYFEDGICVMSKHYLDDVLVKAIIGDEEYTFYPNGLVQSKKKKAFGITQQELYYPTGELQCEGKFIDGVPIGKVKMYNLDGSFDEMSPHIEGTLLNYYYPSGELMGSCIRKLDNTILVEYIFNGSGLLLSIEHNPQTIL